ncbi:MAG: hypothetical protein JNL11_02270 [Bdellovibrionaceae bacterium]|nr:hypothetical protein [Pseudobdellovibrionaceae bacterium]
MLKSVVSVLFVFMSFQALAVQALVTKPMGPVKGLVVIAPAKKYLMQERLFSSLAEALVRQGFLAVRFNWSLDTLQIPELELQRAERDIQNVVLSTQRTFGIKPEQTILISKSFSTKALTASLSLAKSHILLTPNCSADAPFYQTYKNVLHKTGISLKIVISVDDPYCHVSEIYQTLNAIKRPQLLATTKGDHNFVVLDATTKTPIYAFQDLVVRYVVDFIYRTNGLSTAH